MVPATNDSVGLNTEPVVLYKYALVPLLVMVMAAVGVVVAGVVVVVSVLVVVAAKNKSTPSTSVR